MANKTNILIALSGLHRVNRGAERSLEELAEHLARSSDHRVTVIGSGPSRKDTTYEYRQVPAIRRDLFQRFPKFPGLRTIWDYEDLTFAPGLLRAFQPNDFDLTLTCGYPYTNWVLRARRNAARPRHVFVTQNGDWMAHSRSAEFRFFSCDGLVCTNPVIHERNRDRWLCRLIPNGVNTTQFQPRACADERFGISDGCKSVAIVAALDADKRVIEGIRCTAKLAGRIQLIVAGDGPLKSEVIKIGNSLMPGRFRQIVLLREDMPALYRATDVLLHMSKSEPFGNIYVEASACGTPIVAHDTPATRWILGSDGCHLVDTDDEVTVIRAMELAIKSGRGTGREAARRFDWTCVASQYSDFFQEVISRPSARTALT